MSSVNSNRIMKVFEQYVREFDMNRSSVKMRYFHSLKTMELCRKMATQVGFLTEEEIVVCELIGLFHEIGGFTNINQYHMIDEEDYTMKSIDILFEQGLIKKITNTRKYDDLIKLVIYCHNKKGLPKGLDKKTTAICYLVRDVHKLETLRLTLNYSYIDNHVDSYPSGMVYNDFKKFKSVSVKVTESGADEVISVLSNIFDLKYALSFHILAEENYVGKIIDDLIFANRDIKKFFKQIEVVLNTYIKKKIGVKVAK